MIANLYGPWKWYSVLAKEPATDDVRRMALRQLVCLAISGTRVDTYARLLPEFPTTATVRDITESGLATVLQVPFSQLGTSGRSTEGGNRIFLPFIVVAVLNEEFSLLHEDIVNPFKYDWPTFELLALESIRFRLNVLAARDPERLVRVGDLRPGAIVAKCDLGPQGPQRRGRGGSPRRGAEGRRRAPRAPRWPSRA